MRGKKRPVREGLTESIRYRGVHFIGYWGSWLGVQPGGGVCLTAIGRGGEGQSFFFEGLLELLWGCPKAEGFSSYTGVGD